MPVPSLAGAWFVPGAGSGQDDCWVTGVGPRFGEHLADAEVDRPAAPGAPLPPDLLEEHLPGEHLAGFAGQRDQQVELERRQLHVVAVAADRVSRYVDGDLVAARADGQQLGGDVLTTA